MGIITKGIPQDVTIQLAKLNETAVFVETGTFLGSSTRWAAGHFATVHTIERAEKLFNLYSPDLSKIRGVHPHLGDSRKVLPEIVADLGDRTALFWLDGHWSGPETAGAEDDCPLLGELAALSLRHEDIILIDDASLFLSAPPSPHDPSKWPTIFDIVHALPQAGTKHFIQIVDDVIFVVPKKDALVKCLVDHAQRRSTAFWEVFSNPHTGKPSLAGGLNKAFTKIKRGMTSG